MAWAACIKGKCWLLYGKPKADAGFQNAIFSPAFGSPVSLLRFPCCAAVASVKAGDGARGVPGGRDEDTGDTCKQNSRDVAVLSESWKSVTTKRSVFLNVKREIMI